MGGQGAEIEAEFGDLARRIVMDEEVGPGDSAEEGGPIGDGVEGDTTLIGIQIEKETALFGVGLMLGEGSTAAGLIATGRLDFDDVGTEIGEEFGGVRGGDQIAHFENTDAFET